MESRERSTPASAATERLHSLDAVRAGALLLGVVLHATMPYLPGEQVWAVRDGESAALGVVFFVVHVFRMSLFFLLAGFFGRLALQRKGLGPFVRDRWKRIALPLFAFWPPLFASIAALFVWGVVRQHGLEGAQEMPQPEGSLVETFPLTHLWFLYVLLALYAGALAVRGLAARLDPGQRLHRGVDAALGALVRSGLAPLLLAAPTAAALALREGWLLWLGVPTPDVGLIPNAPAVAAYGTAFGFGWLLHRRLDLLPVFERRWVPHLAMAVALSAAYASIVGVSATLDPTAQPAAALPALRLALAACYPLATWTWCFGLIGLALRFLSAPRPAIRYAADSSYWVYLIHLPVLMAGQVLLFPVDLPALAKFALLLGVAGPLLPLSYHLMVRRSFLGAFLNGKRHPRSEGRGETASRLAA